MSKTDAALGRELMKDELDTTSKYERMADMADNEGTAEVIRDVADEEKVHTGEGAAIVAANDPRAKPAMLEGVKEASEYIPRFQEIFDSDEGL